MTEPQRRGGAEAVLSVLRATRQIRQFTDEPVAEADLETILDVARWSGSAMNRQPWTFVVIRDPATRQRLAELAPNAGHIGGSAVAIAVAMGGESAEIDGFDEGRAAERILIAAHAVGLGAAIGWAMQKVRPAVGELLGVAPPAFVRTIVSIGHPSEAGLRRKAAPGTARRPLAELVRNV